MKERIKDFFENKKFARITRQVSEDSNAISRGYIVDFSNDFIVIHETDDFKMLGYSILPIKDIKELRYNNYDRYYDKIMKWEQEKDNITLKSKVNLKNWKSIFETFQANKSNIIVYREDPEFDSFTIGSIEKVTTKSVYILYFDANGFWDKEPTKIGFANITKILFDDRYIDVFSKYTRKRKILSK
ncbi:MAG: hypothetical protein FWH36_00385 [Lentimicrobiaceae bacterium]|nr:hypothetical protein [Lentimicrobiaceae bacterium]